MPPKSRTIFCRTMPGSPTRMRSVWRPGLSMWSVDLLTAQLRSTLSNHTCEYSTCDEEGVATDGTVRVLEWMLGRLQGKAHGVENAEGTTIIAEETM